MQGDTIAAVSTAMSSSGIGIIRISGSESFAIADRIYSSKGGRKRLSDQKSHTIHYGFIKDGDEVIDEVLVMLMRGPRSYTAEDTVEINCHGGVYAMRRVLDTAVKNGARPAEPGEFTKRAFLNGRLDLSQAEAVMDIIQAKNEYALKSSLSQLKGSVREAVRSIREKIIYHIAYIESALDDPEHISLEGYPGELDSVVDELQGKLGRLIDSAEDGRVMAEGIRTVIVGKPNAGKSSLMNLLVGEERAIVTDIAGTTRDILEENISLSGISLNIIDTAGIRDTKDVVEQIGVSRAKEYAKDADLIIYVVDASTGLDDNDEQIIEMLRGRQAIVLLNKADLEAVTTEEMLSDKVEGPVISISVKENTGIGELENQLKSMFYKGDISFNDEVYITNIRHKAALVSAKESLSQVRDSIAVGMPEDFYSIDLMSAYEELGTIIGESVGEDLVNEIFSKFCMGK
ncbi:tRNA uridine-5-carboxymethylaminomethyl(34) synthesis GTPase MnmE [Murimonas intestini]|uniref:tRNA modification GTPase MnmE n=1 Tax=Murimonas intestini TaxID=1337051 RepID=A0AB73SXW8_9FIRM|nr:tRNA uridine-5-carboxymethylaminomethyl(34) synthesis GTPase MnmE [Murimonas intestini]MCR1843119.1 tRNA uridine-5-carboxymethylaminomethyl(34) synthesis GTPase MnmE [Murimonas intestini]MCR1868428.1 tRNA uridine-5-carboxymethylaminomethyl(34) synthesis GTPase MnmE [Murimonas intestini]MCR1885872.1 tRNA uridine-5-carboxymethylaminomethyl(34) synthesis GTPase MnmE [Murimonas intestini]